MNCSDARFQLGPDRGPRPPADSCAAWDHVAACPACQHFYDGQARIASRLAGFREVSVPLSLQAAVSTALSRQAAPARWARRLRWAVPIAAAAAVALFAVTQPSQSDALAAPLAAAARSESELTMATDDHTDAETWLEQTLGYHIAIPNIAEAALVGARVSNLNGDRYAAVVFMSRGMPVTYFALPSGHVMGQVVRPDRVVAGSSDGYQVALWTEGGKARAIASPLPRSDVVEIANECRSKALTD